MAIHLLLEWFACVFENRDMILMVSDWPIQYSSAMICVGIVKTSSKYVSIPPTKVLCNLRLKCYWLFYFGNVNQFHLLDKLSLSLWFCFLYICICRAARYIHRTLAHLAGAIRCPLARYHFYLFVMAKVSTPVTVIDDVYLVISETTAGNSHPEIDWPIPLNVSFARQSLE